MPPGCFAAYAQRGIGDVLITWENEAILAQKEAGPGVYEIVVPPTSILAEPPVALVEKIARRHGTTDVANAYLNYLYSDEGQEIAARNGYRPRSEIIFKKHGSQFPAVKLYSVDDVFGGWQKAQKTHFADGGEFDKLYQK